MRTVRPELLVTRKGSWVALLVAAVVTTALMGMLQGGNPPGAADALPDGSESAAVRALTQQFPDSELAPVVAVFTRHGETLSPSDITAVEVVGTRLSDEAGKRAAAPVVSEDGRAAMVSVLVGSDRSNGDEVVDRLRATARGATPDGMTVALTGGPAFGADIAAAFDGANLTLLAVTIAIVALLLLLTYRSPILFLVPLTVVGLADRLAGLLTAWLGEVWGLRFDAGIISVLVFGAGANYALLLISRYREELYRRDDHRAALGTALRATAPAILASNVTVVLSLLTLVFAVLPSTRGLGVAAAVGLLVALAFALLVLPPALAVCGRGVFWPFVPRAGQEPGRPGTWLRLATAVNRRPGVVVAVSVAGLAVLACGVLGTRVGLTQLEKFRVPSESADGFAVLAAHFPPGESTPMTVIARGTAADAVAEAADRVPGVDRTQVGGASNTGLTRITVIGDAAPGTDADLRTVAAVREAVHAVPDADALVGGGTAESLDVADAARRDLTVIVPMVLGVALLLLILLLRALLAPALLVLINVVSALAAIGAGTWVGKTLFGFPALDVNVPLLSFLFLVALGIDYTIFLVHRARQEAANHGTRDGMIRAVSHTGVVITSAGVVLAAVFAALGLLPLTTLAQLGLIVGLGVLIDTAVVRTVVVPAVFALVGDRIWWPRR